MTSPHKNKALTLLQQLDYLPTDYAPLGMSKSTFPDGSHFLINVIAFNTPQDIQTFLKLSKEEGVHPNRLACTKGAFFLEDDEITEMLRLCDQQDIQLSMGLSCRAEYDHKSAFRKSQYGLIQARRLDNLDAITHTIEEVCRLEQLGVKILIIYDIGILKVLKDLRDNGQFANMSFTLSSHNNCSNYLIAQIFQALGAEFAVMPPNVQLPMLNMIRQTCKTLIPQVSIDVYGERGGFIRINEVSEIISTCSPVILKFGASVRSGPYCELSEKDMLDILKIIRVTITRIKHDTDFTQSGV